MPHDVIMPALGMAQDTGHLLAWRKSLGDEVKAGDVLMEVETDKAAMEVEAAQDGFLAEILAEAGTDVPVGEVIARIAEDEGAVKAGSSAPAAKDDMSPGPDAEVQPENKAAVPEQVEVKTQPAPKPAPLQHPVPARQADARILASPKAKLEAHRRGITLEELRRQGVAEPFHTADLDRFTPAIAAPSAASRLEAECGSRPFDDFTAWVAGETEGKADAMAIWSAFVAGSLRQALSQPPDGGVVIRYVGSSGEQTASLDADRAGLSAITPSEEDSPPAMTVIDLRGTAASAYAPPEAATPVLVITNSEGALRLALHFSEESLPFPVALALVNGVTARLRDPLTHLL